MSRAALLIAVLVAAVLTAGSAQGVTPGKNGLIYFENFDETSQSSDIFAVSPTGAGVANITKTETIDETEPAVSPNGRLVAFVSNQGSETYHLRVMNSDGTGTRTLTNASGVEQGSPTWSPKGDQLAFSRCLGVDEDTGDCIDGQIAVIQADGTNLRVVTTRVAQTVDSRPTWSSNGRWIVFQRMNDEGETSLWRVKPTGRPLQRILNDESFVDRNPSFTPDSKQLIFFSDVGGREGIWRANANGHSKKRLFAEVPDPTDPEIGQGTENPAVSPSGKQFVYTAGGDLWVAAINGSNRTQITTNGGDEADWARG